MIANFDIGDSLTNRLDDSTALVSADDWESAFRILSREGICIRMTDLDVSPKSLPNRQHRSTVNGREECIPQSKESLRELHEPWEVRPRHLPPTIFLPPPT